MDENQIRIILSTIDSCAQEFFRGIFDRTNILTKGTDVINTSKKNIFIIFTGDKHSKTGGHWLTVLLTFPEEKTYFLDSLGANAIDYGAEIGQFVGADYWKLPFRLQGFSSNVCGLWSVYYSYYYSRNILPEIVTEYLDPSGSDNDAILIQWWKSSLGKFITLNESNANNVRRSKSYDNYVKNLKKE